MSRPGLAIVARDRCRSSSIRRSPADSRNRSSWICNVTFLVFFYLSTVFAAAQLTTASSATSGSTQRVSLAASPALVRLPSLNATRSAVEVSFPPTPNLFLTFNLCSLTSNTSLLPTVLIATTVDPSWAFGARSTADAGSGGTAEGGYNRRSRDGGLWSLTWDKGFGNWTMIGLGPGETVKVLLDLGFEADGSTRSSTGVGNVNVQLGISSLSKFCTAQADILVDCQIRCIRCLQTVHTWVTLRILRPSSFLLFSIDSHTRSPRTQITRCPPPNYPSRRSQPIPPVQT
jgi:hypothetical protein